MPPAQEPNCVVGRGYLQSCELRNRHAGHNKHAQPQMTLAENVIPQRIVQYWESGAPPECTHVALQKNRLHNPRWEVLMLSAKDVKSLLIRLEMVVPNITRAYGCIHSAYPQARSDFVRYGALFLHGGVWLDVKSATNEPLHGIFGGAEAKFAHFSEQAAAPRPHTLLTWACAAPAGHPALSTILRVMTAAVLLDQQEEGGIDAAGKQAILSLTGPRLLTRALSCHVASGVSSHNSNNNSAHHSSCEAQGVKLHTRDFEGRLTYDATHANRPLASSVPSCYRNSASRAQYQNAVEHARSDECRAWLRGSLKPQRTLFNPVLESAALNRREDDVRYK